jgi:hypothetical protein
MNLTFDPQLIHILKWNWISTTPAILVSILARISVTILLIRVFGNKAWLKWFLIIFTAIQSIVATLVIIFVWVQVSPVEGLWNPFLPARRWDPRIQQTSTYLGQCKYSSLLLDPPLRVLAYYRNSPVHLQRSDLRLVPSYDYLEPQHAFETKIRPRRTDGPLSFYHGYLHHEDHNLSIERWRRRRPVQRECRNPMVGHRTVSRHHYRLHPTSSLRHQIRISYSSLRRHIPCQFGWLSEPGDI